ncbi:MAG: hypothetical protein WCD70_04210 [Alphaproteobacteria bacterium]
MTRVFLAFFLLSLLFARPASAQDVAEMCDLFADVPVTITPMLEDATFDYSTSISGLHALETSTPHFYERLLLGVTTYKPDISVISSPESITLADGSHCIKIASVEIKMVYKDVVVHVASEIPQGSCGFNLVVEHEQKHVNTNQQVIMDYIPVMQDKMHEYLKVFGRIHDPDYGHAMTVMHDKTKSYVGELLHDLSQEENNRQQQIDSDAEFQQLTRSCNGQLGQIAAQYHRTGGM